MRLVSNIRLIRCLSSRKDRTMTNSTMQTIVVIGSTGLIGSAVVGLLSDADRARRYRVLGATPRTAPPLDLEDSASVRRYFERIAPVHHVVVTAGDARFGHLLELTAEDFAVGLRSKLMGQVNVVREAAKYIIEPGSITLTSGALAHSPIPGSSAVALVNGALDSFVRAAGLDLPAALRVNVVSPGWLAETRRKLGLDPAGSVTARDVAVLYLQALEGDARGRVFAADSLAAKAG
jgi:NAD(P)-dependent dehydrogenase (short-subunit alcohol dehydrogenase family)